MVMLGLAHHKFVIKTSGEEIEAGTLLIELGDGTEQASLKAALAQLRTVRSV